jgi:hypothetical protein
MFRAGSGETLHGQLAATAEGNAQNASPGCSSRGCPCRFCFRASAAGHDAAPAERAAGGGLEPVLLRANSLSP